MEVDQSDLWTSKRCKKAHPKCPTLYYVREADGVIELHVDDGHGCGKETVIAELLSFLSKKIEIKVVQGIKCGSYEYLKTVKMRDGKKLTSIPNKKHLQSALKKWEMSDCKGSVSPKLGQVVHRRRQRGIEWRTSVKNGHPKHSSIVKGTEDMSTVFEMRGNNDRRGQTV